MHSHLSSFQVVWLRSLLFSLVFPGIVIGLVPWLLLRWFPPDKASVNSIAYLGILLAGLGVLAYLRCAWDFAAVGRGTPAPWDPPRRLVTVGLYRFVRNPIFLALVLVVLGEAVYFQARVLLGYAAYVFAAFHARVVLFEEPALRAQFGDAYEEYRVRVPRWLPRWRSRAITSFTSER